MKDILKRVEDVYDNTRAEMSKYIYKDKNWDAVDERKDRASVLKGHIAVRLLAKEFGWNYTRKKNG